MLAKLASRCSRTAAFVPLPRNPPMPLLLRCLPSSHHPVVVVPLAVRSISSSSVVQLRVRGSSSSSSTHKPPTPDKPERSIEEVLRDIDTTLTPEQRAHVDGLKKQIRGGPNAPRSLYRDVATPDELVGEGNFFPRLADNAEALIDYALSHIPKRDGYRGSRRKKRMAARHTIKVANDKRRKEETAAAVLRKHAKAKKDRELAKSYRAQAATLRQIADLRAEVRREKLQESHQP